MNQHDVVILLLFFSVLDIKPDYRGNLIVADDKEIKVWLIMPSPCFSSDKENPSDSR